VDSGDVPNPRPQDGAPPGGGAPPEGGGPARGAPPGGGGPPGGGAAPAAERRQLSFRASGLTVELEMTGGGDHRRVAGQLIPRQPASVEIRTAGGVITAVADPLGRFSADAVPTGPVSLRCRLGTEQSPVVTGWITLAE
jgi:hypothetical protein